MDTVIKNQIFDEERALYNLKNARVENCTFAGEADGESVLKETRNVEIDSCSFSLRYPIWHAEGFKLTSCTLDEKTRAPIWYSCKGVIKDCEISSVKALRECNNVTILHSKIISPEFGWKCSDIGIYKSDITSEYIFLDTKNLSITNLTMKGKYSFQYTENARIENSFLDTKDAFWHSNNVTVVNCTVKGEYLAWFSKNLTMVNCKIIGTQPFCYCQNLTLIDCTMEGCDLSFENSAVFAKINGHIDSVKNPREGEIIADSIGEIIRDSEFYNSNAEITVK